jgi:hypothetical protein
MPEKCIKGQNNYEIKRPETEKEIYVRGGEDGELYTLRCEQMLKTANIWLIGNSFKLMKRNRTRVTT